MSYPVEWQGQTLMLGDITKGVKDAYVKWLKPRVLKEAKETLEAGEYAQFRSELMAGSIYWSASPSVPVAVSLATEEGVIQLHRLLFGDAVKAMPDAELLALLNAKNDDPTSDYRIAFDLAWESSDPKAKRPAVTSAGQTPPTS